MSAPTHQLTEIASRAQKAVGTAVRTWTDTLGSLTGGLAGGGPKLLDPQAVVDGYFDLAQQMLDTQRQFARTVLALGTQAAETLTGQVAKAAEGVASTAADTAESATPEPAKPIAALEPAQPVAERAPVKARASKPAAKPVDKS